MPSPAELFGPLLYLALAEPIGLVCQTSGGFDRAVQRLYAARRELGDPELEGLQFRRSAGEGDLLVLNRRVERGKESMMRKREDG